MPHNTNDRCGRPTGVVNGQEASIRKIWRGQGHGHRAHRGGDLRIIAADIKREKVSCKPGGAGSVNFISPWRYCSFTWQDYVISGGVIPNDKSLILPNSALQPLWHSLSLEVDPGPTTKFRKKSYRIFCAPVHSTV